MLSIAASTLLFFGLFSGTGLWFWHPRDPDAPKPESLIAAFWTGWAITLVYLQIWHLFYKVGLLSLLPLAIAGAAGWVRYGRPFWAWLRSLPARTALINTGIAALFLLLLSNQAIWSSWPVDLGLYHTQTVKWISEYAIIPGLGNLHHRLAFNNSSFLYAAQLNTWVWSGLAFYLTNTLLVFALGLRSLVALNRVLQDRQPLHLTDVYYSFFMPILLFYVSTALFAGYGTDVIVFVLQVVIGGALLHIFSAQPIAAAALRRQVTYILLLCAVGVTVKLSFAVFGAFAILAAWVVFARRENFRTLFRGQLLASWAAVLVLPVLPWLVRHIILSGYLVYPSPLISFPVRWKIPYDLVEPITATIHNWAMGRAQYTPGMPAGDWFAIWFPPIQFELKEAVVYFVACLLLAAALRIFGKKRPVVKHGPLTLIGINLLSLVYWFLTAPDPRFAGAAVWLLLVSALLLVFQQVIQTGYVRSAHLLTAAVVILLFFWLGPHFTNNISLSRLVTPPFEQEIAAEQSPSGEQPFRVTNSGLQVYIAADEQAELCWDAPLPCTRAHDFDPRLALLRPGDLQGGFYVDDAQ
jgi:hypothetical protein